MAENQARPSCTGKDGSGSSRRSTPKSRRIVPVANGVSSMGFIATTSPGLAPRTTISLAIGASACPSQAGANGVGIALNILDIVEGAADLNGQHRTTPIRGRRMLAGDLALMIAAVFTGAATTSTSSSSQRALQLDDRSFPAEWKPAYKRGYMMQASLAVVGGLFGLVAYLSTLDWRWLLGAIVLLANWPSTIFSRIGPTRSS